MGAIRDPRVVFIGSDLGPDTLQQKTQGRAADQFLMEGVSEANIITLPSRRNLLAEEGIPENKIFVTGNTIVDAVKQRPRDARRKVGNMFTAFGPGKGRVHPGHIAPAGECGLERTIGGNIAWSGRDRYRHGSRGHPADASQDPEEYGGVRFEHPTRCSDH